MFGNGLVTGYIPQCLTFSFLTPAFFTPFSLHLLFACMFFFSHNYFQTPFLLLTLFLYLLFPYTFTLLTLSFLTPSPCLHFLYPYNFSSFTFSLSLHLLLAYTFSILTTSPHLHFLFPYTFSFLTLSLSLHLLLSKITLIPGWGSFNCQGPATWIFITSPADHTKLPP